MGTASPSTVVLAARLHATDGRRRDDDEALRLLMGAAQAFGAGHPDALLARVPRGRSTGRSSSACAGVGPSRRDARARGFPETHTAPRSAGPSCGTRPDAGRTSPPSAPSSASPEPTPAAPARSCSSPTRTLVLGSLLDLILEAHDGMTDRQRQVVALVREQRKPAGRRAPPERVAPGREPEPRRGRVAAHLPGGVRRPRPRRAGSRGDAGGPGPMTPRALEPCKVPCIDSKTQNGRAGAPFVVPPPLHARRRAIGPPTGSLRPSEGLSAAHCGPGAPAARAAGGRPGRPRAQPCRGPRRGSRPRPRPSWRAGSTCTSIAR